MVPPFTSGVWPYVFKVGFLTIAMAALQSLTQRVAFLLVGAILLKSEFKLLGDFNQVLTKYYRLAAEFVTFGVSVKSYRPCARVEACAV